MPVLAIHLGAPRLLPDSCSRLGSRKSIRAPARSGLRIRAVLDLPKPTITNGTSPDKEVEALRADVLHELRYRVAPQSINEAKLYESVAWSVHNRLVEGLDATNDHWREQDVKQVYYLSAEFLMGRTLTSAVHNLGLGGAYGAILKDYGAALETVASEERDAALGNGGLGRLAACFLDSMATLDLPGWGYGIRYRYGMFKQVIREGYQIEVPDYWLDEGNPWEVRRPDTTYRVGFAGTSDGASWTPGDEVIAEAYDVPIPGYKTTTVGSLRLWNAKPVAEFDLDAFNVGDYDGATGAKRRADDITAVLYPNDATEYGKELRLRQQFFFVSASLQDTLARYLATHSDLAGLPDKAVFQMNDTHPTIAVAELQRLLTDVHGLAWDEAWAITTKSLAYTNHTVMPEALEKWPVAVLQKLLPRHMEIIQRINDEWLASIREHVEAKVAKAPARPAPAEEEADEADDESDTTASGKKPAKKAPLDPVEEALKEYSIVQENPWKAGEMLVNMAYLAVVGSKAVNGVAAIHSEIIKTDLFPQFVEVFPSKFQNKTNGVTLRRWLAYCNPALSALITEALGSDAWVKDAGQLAGLEPRAEDPAFRARWREVKTTAKAALAARIAETTGYEVTTDAMFDIQVKRIHEYKRQLLNAISLIVRYQEIKAMSPEERKKVVPRVSVFGGKAASAYYMAKKIVKLVGAIGAKVNTDPEIGDLLKVIFLPNYNVSEAEVIIPAAELSQHISTGGTEASGTSNMKFALNGCLIIGTMDGANIEIGENTGLENLFIFGEAAEDVPRLRAERKDFTDYDPRYTKALKAVKDGEFGDADYFEDLVDSITDMTKGNDWFLVANDFATYMDAQRRVDELYGDQEEWTRRSILYTARNGFFSSDRTINEYAKDIWGVTPAPPPAPTPTA
uniref:Alpha-1,4 glucan phosphorylase n=1 Tax=Auxenochlorella protothecoides TaxID=3075 RepID=A0A1D2AFX8_AUXPR